MSDCGYKGIERALGDLKWDNRPRKLSEHVTSHSLLRSKPRIEIVRDKAGGGKRKNKRGRRDKLILLRETTVQMAAKPLL